MPPASAIGEPVAGPALTLDPESPGPAPAGSGRRNRRAARSWAAGGATSGLGLGVAMLYMSVIVLIPLAAVVAKAFSQSPSDLWQSVSNDAAVKALVTTVVIAMIVAAIDAVMGTIVAWVLVRDEFRGKSVVNALIDLPFALPTIVAGLTLLVLYGDGSPFGLNIAYTRGIVVIALMFITLPFVVRSVQPVLLELNREVEEAAASLGASNVTIVRRIILPALRPAMLSGSALSFARAIGEIGSIFVIVGKVQIASIVIYGDVENDSPKAAASLSVILILISLAVLAGIRRVGGRVAH